MENNIHFLLQTPNRTLFANAMRFLAGQIALKIQRGKLWLKRMWSRVVSWGRDYGGVKRYVEANPVKAGIFSEGVDLWSG